MKSYQEIQDKRRECEQEVLRLAPYADSHPGIYVFYRADEYGFKYAYVGQAKDLLRRLVDHLVGYDYDSHIDKSIKVHKLWSRDNPYGYQIRTKHCPQSILNEEERAAELVWANEGYQLRNKTVGGQDSGKAGLNSNKSSRGYQDGLKQGYENARREVAHLFKLHLNVSKKSDKPHKVQEKALAKFLTFIGETEDDED